MTFRFRDYGTGDVDDDDDGDESVYIWNAPVE